MEVEMLSTEITLGANSLSFRKFALVNNTLICTLKHRHAKDYNLIETFFSREALERLLLSTHLN